jgi:oligopeptide transport system permease protein
MAAAPGAAFPEEIVAESFEMPVQVSLWNDAWRRLRRNKLAVAGLAIVALLFVVAAIGHFWTPYPTWQQAIGPTYEGLSLRHPLGLDDAGRDILSRIMGGAEIAVIVGVGTALLVSVVGITVGLIAGFYRGWLDTVISLLINIWYGIPGLLVALIMVVLIGRGLQNIVLAIAITGWMDMARLVRGQAMSLSQREFVESARSVGSSNMKIMLRHIFPNALGPIIVQATFLVPQAILFEAFLSFLGLGVKPPTPSWGFMAAQAFHSLQIAPHIALAPAIALSITLLGVNWLGDGLRDALDPRMKR